MIYGEEKFERVVEELLDEIAGFPNVILNNDDEVKQKSPLPPNRALKKLSSMQHSVENLRICIKYLLFDLDATRRETLYYKKLLEEK